jgi:TatD DNase family protein
MIPRVSDIHTHNPEARDAVINLTPQMAMRPDALYSVGLHPWFEATPELWQWVCRMARHPQVALIGECGLDRLRGLLPLPEQIEIFRQHILLSEAVGRPLLIHCVRASAELLHLHKTMHPTQPWIYHGFRGRLAQAEQLLAAGLYLSLGPNAPATLCAAIAAHPRILHETDDGLSQTLP